QSSSSSSSLRTRTCSTRACGCEFMACLSRLPAQEIRQQAQPGGLALFGMELRAEDIVAPHRRRHRAAIIRAGQHLPGIAGMQMIGMHEVGMLAFGYAIQQGVARPKMQLVP